VYSSPNIIRVIESRRMELVVHVARTGKIKMHYSENKGEKIWET
jgi:hypothetical protein